MTTDSLKYSMNNQGAHRFTMWMFIVTTCMIFAGFTSAFLVREGAGGAWTSFNIPNVFKVSTLLIFLSSISLQVAHVFNKKDNLKLTVFFLFITLILGISFCYSQIQGWAQLRDMGVYLSFNPNPAGPYFLVITFIHALHVSVGIIFLFIAFCRAIYLLRKQQLNSSKAIIHSDNSLLSIRTDLLTMFWHFMGILWIYLYLFLSINLK